MHAFLKNIDILPFLFKRAILNDLKNRNFTIKTLCVVLLMGWGIMSLGYMFATGVMQFLSVIIDGGLKTPVLYLFSFVLLGSSFFVRYHPSVIKYLSQFSLFSEPITSTVGLFHNALLLRMFGSSFLIGMLLSFSGFAGLNGLVNPQTYQFYSLNAGLISIGFFSTSAIIYFVATMIPVLNTIRLLIRNLSLK